MSSSSIPDLIQYINGNIKLLSPYYENIKAKTRSKVTPEYEGAIYFISKKLLEDAYLSGESFPDDSSIELLLSKLTFNSIYQCYSNKTIQSFLDEIRHIATEYGNTMIIEDIKFKVKQFNFMSMSFSVIQSICEEYFVSPPNVQIEEYDKELFLYWIWLLFSLFNQNLLNKTIEVPSAMELLSHILQEVKAHFNETNANNNTSFTFNNEYFFGLIQEKLSKTSIVFLKQNSGLSNLTNAILSKMRQDIKAFIPKGSFIYSNDAQVLISISHLEHEINIKMNKDDVSVISVYHSFPIETFNKQIELINAQLQSKHNQRMNTTLYNNTNNTNAMCLNSIKLKMGLEAFIEDLKAYNYLDITFLFARYTKLLFVQPPFTFRILYKEFYNEYIEVNYAKLNLRFNYIFIKSIFIKLIHVSFHNKITDSQLIFDKNFYYNFLIISFYLYFNLQFIDNQTLIVNLTYVFIHSINSYAKFTFIDVYSLVMSLLKLQNLPFNLRTIIRKIQQDLLSFCLFEKNSFVYAYLKPKTNDQLKPPKIMRTIIDDFYQYSFDIIYKIGNKLGYSIEKKEEVFKYYLLIVTSIETIQTYMRDVYVDITIIVVIACFQAKSEDDLKAEFNKVKLRYNEEKKKSLIPEIHQVFLNEANGNGNGIGNGFNEAVLKEIYKLKGSSIESIGTKADIMATNYDCRSFFIKATQYFNTIYSCSVSPQKTIESDNISSHFLTNKRIRALTPTIHDKTLHASPFISKTANYNNCKPVGAFKNLNQSFL